MAVVQKLLVANTSQSVSRLLGRAISRRLGQVQIDYAADGEAAISVLTNSDDDFTCVLLCRPLTEASVWEVLQVIRDEENGWPEVPVVVAAPHPSIEGAAKAWRLGANEYVSACPDKIIGVVHQTVAISAGMSRTRR